MGTMQSLPGLQWVVEWVTGSQCDSDINKTNGINAVFIPCTESTALSQSSLCEATHVVRARNPMSS